MISTLSHAASSTENDLAGIIAQKDFLISQLRAHNHELAIKWLFRLMSPPNSAAIRHPNPEEVAT